MKRGCAALCPNGVIPPGDGSRCGCSFPHDLENAYACLRFVFAAEEHIRAETKRLEQRMHALEDALAILQSVESTEPHPLLSQPTSLDEDPLDIGRDNETKRHEEAEEPALRDAFGALHIDDANGASMFFGPSGVRSSFQLSVKLKLRVCRDQKAYCGRNQMLNDRRLRMMNVRR